MYTLSDLFPGNYPINQYYGNNPKYMAGKYYPNGYYYTVSGGSLAGHEGVDWGTPNGVQLLCPFNQGIILRAGWDPVYGYYLVIWDPVQLCAVWYCHLSRYYYNAGARISRFAVVGLTGSSGNVTGPHLHCNFVETDQYANRLNRNNGYQGFINILGSKVRWELSK